MLCSAVCYAYLDLLSLWMNGLIVLVIERRSCSFVYVWDWNSVEEGCFDATAFWWPLFAYFTSWHFVPVVFLESILDLGWIRWSVDVCASRLNFYLSHASMWKCVFYYKRRILKDIDAHVCAGMFSSVISYWFSSSVGCCHWSICRFSLFLKLSVYHCSYHTI